MIPASRDAARVLSQVRIFIISTQDSRIGEAASWLAGKLSDGKGRVVLHSSGSLGVSALVALKGKGYALGTLHPLQTFPSPAREKGVLENIPFCYDGDERAIHVIKEITEALGARAFRVRDERRALYHAASSLASNALVALTEVVRRLLSLATDEREGLELIMPLMEKTLSSVKERGIESALTGPIARGDLETVRKHMESLPERYRDVYKSLGKVQVELSREKKSLTGTKADDFFSIFQ